MISKVRYWMTESETLFLVSFSFFKKIFNQKRCWQQMVDLLIDGQTVHNTMMYVRLHVSLHVCLEKTYRYLLCLEQALWRTLWAAQINWVQGDNKNKAVVKTNTTGADPLDQVGHTLYPSGYCLMSTVICFLSLHCITFALLELELLLCS